MAFISEKGCPYGSHPAAGGMPQPAARLDTSTDLWSNQVLIDVELLNLDKTAGTCWLGAAADGLPMGTRMSAAAEPPVWLLRGVKYFTSHSRLGLRFIAHL